MAFPNPADRVTIKSGGGGPVNLVSGPGGDIFYPGYNDDRLHRIRYTSGNLPPTAVAQANPTSGTAPLTVNFNAGASSDPEGQALAYAWDLDGDGAFDDSTSANPSFTYGAGGLDHRPPARHRRPGALRRGGRRHLGEQHGADRDDRVAAGRRSPGGSATAIAFSGSASDPQEGSLPPSALTWSVIMHHCPSNCHTHDIQQFVGVASGSFPAPDHEYPSHLELRLTATDGGGLQSTASVLLNPQTVDADVPVQPHGTGAGRQRDVGGDAVQPHGHHRLEQLRQRAGAADTRGDVVRLLVVVRRRRPGAQRHRARVRGDLHRDLHAGRRGAGTDCRLRVQRGQRHHDDWMPPVKGTSDRWPVRRGPPPGRTGTRSTSTAPTISSRLPTRPISTSQRASPSRRGSGRPRSPAGGRSHSRKRQGGLAYALYAHDNAPRPAGTVNTGGIDVNVTGTSALALNTWTHLAVTYDGSNARLYVNGGQVGVAAATGALRSTGNPLTIGGNNVWGEWFAGQIDDVRIYNRALSAGEIATDMTTPVGGAPPPDTTPPTVSITSPAPAAIVGGHRHDRGNAQATTPARSRASSFSWTASRSAGPTPPRRSPRRGRPVEAATARAC